MQYSVFGKIHRTFFSVHPIRIFCKLSVPSISKEVLALRHLSPTETCRENWQFRVGGSRILCLVFLTLTWRENLPSEHRLTLSLCLFNVDISQSHPSAHLSISIAYTNFNWFQEYKLIWRFIVFQTMWNCSRQTEARHTQKM